MHQELSTLRSQIDTRSRRPVGGAEDFNARPVRKEERVKLENLVIFGRDFVGVVHAALKQAMKTAENQKQPIAVTHLQHEFGVTNEMDQELQQSSISRTGRRSSGSCPWS